MRTVLALLILTAPALADDPQRGQVIYMTHCAVCHGTGATGDGPMTPVLHVPPTDLTALTVDGVFPMRRVLSRITGEEMQVHGGPMPLFGMILQGEAEAVLLEDGTEMVVPEAVGDVAAWLRTINE